MALTKITHSAVAFLLAGLVHGASPCKPDSVAKPNLFGINVVDVSVKEVTGWTEYGPLPTLPELRVERRPLDFCNITVTYTHPGLNDTVNVHVWLPLSETDWNGRFLGQGGGGFLAGGEGALGPGVALGYAAANTDAGHNAVGDFASIAVSCESWALTSPGNVNQVLLQDFGYRSLDDLAQIGKAVVKNYYKKAARYAYWNGCSTGGRQGLVLAQRYPDHFDGILAVAPAINWVTFLVTEYWAHVVMKKLDYYPPACELTALTAAAIEACDGLDGVKDGMIAAPGLCKFDPLSIVGQDFDCEGDSRRITTEGARVAAAAWTGPTKDGKPVWFGLTHETSLIGLDPFLKGLATTSCSTTNKNCKSDPFPISADWIRHFLKKDPTFDLGAIDEDAFFDLMRISRQEFHSIMDSADPDLRPFQKSGGKMITWHGLADQLIMPNGSSNYYERVRAISPDVQDFYRYFEVPGVAHCAGGQGAFPGYAFTSLVDWVEKGKAPDRLDAESLPAEKNEAVKARPICAYPLVAAYKGGDSDKASSFECAASFDAFGKRSHDEL